MSRACYFFFQLIKDFQCCNSKWKFISGKHKSQLLSQLLTEHVATKNFSSTVEDLRSHEMECVLIM